MEDFFEKLKSFKLSASEKSEMRGKLEKMIKISVASREGRDVETYPELGMSGIFVWMGSRKNVFVAALVLLLFVSGGLSYGSIAALPGDILYPIKTSVLEPLRGGLTFTAKAKAEWQSIIAETRLIEVEKLVSEGKLSPEISSKLDHDIKLSTVNFKNQINNLNANENSAVAAELSLKFESSLRAHGQVISSLSGEGKAGRIVAMDKFAADSTMMQAAVSPSEAVLSRLKSASKDIESIRVKEENNLRGRSRDALKKVATEKLADVTSDYIELVALVSARTPSLAAPTLAQVNNSLDSASSTIAVGRVELNQEKYLESFGTFQKADQIINRARVAVNAPTRANVANIESKPSASLMAVQQISDSDEIKPKVPGWNYIFGSSTSDSEDDSSSDSRIESSLKNDSLFEND